MNVSKPQGLLRRGNVWYYRRRIPLDLIQRFGGKLELKESLGTSDLAQAKARRNSVAAKFDAAFQAARGQPNLTAASHPKEHVLKSVRDYVAGETEKRARQFTLADWANDPEGTADARNETTANILFYRDPSHDATVQAISTAAREIFGEDASALQLENWELLQRAILELERRDLARMEGDYRLPTFDHLFARPVVAARSSKISASLSLGELVGQYRADYEKTKSVGEKRLSKVAAALELIIRFFGKDTLINEIDRKRCREFRDLLNELPSNLRKHFPEDNISFDKIKRATVVRKLGLLARDTQDVYFNALKRLLNWAKNEGSIERNPANDLFPLREKMAAKEARNPFTRDQLHRIFNAPLYRGSIDDGPGFGKQGPTVHRGTRFWVPLIGLFTGMRLNEICQLDCDDVGQSEEGVYFFSVNADGPDKRLKNQNSKRSIPIHPVLLKAGFLRFVASRRKKSRKLFSDLVLSNRGYYSERLSRWFDENFLPSIKAKTGTTSFHSFRHSFRDSLRAIHAPAAVVEGLGGWKMEEGVSSRYGSGLPVEQLVSWMERVEYKGLDLSHLYMNS